MSKNELLFEFEESGQQVIKSTHDLPGDIILSVGKVVAYLQTNELDQAVITAKGQVGFFEENFLSLGLQITQEALRLQRLLFLWKTLSLLLVSAWIGYFSYMLAVTSK
jgi:hypothetical protein